MQKTEVLPLDYELFEKVIIYNSLTDSSYLESIIGYTKPSYFKNKDLRIIYEIIHSYYLEYKKIPNNTELKVHITDKEKRNILKNVILSFKDIDRKYDKIFLFKNTERFLKEKSVLATVLKTSVDVQSGDIDSNKILKDFESACNISLTESLGFDYLEQIDDHCKDLQKTFETISSGWSWLDEKLGGGFQKHGRALYVFFGHTNVGKSIFLGNISANILSQDKTVVLLTFEMAETVYAKRISTKLSNIPFDELKNNIEPLKEKLGHYKLKHGNAKLIIKEFPPKSVNPLQIKIYIEKLIRKGIKPDAIVIDYLNLLDATNKHSGSYEKIKEITEEIRALTYVFECPVISATQATRNSTIPNAVPDLGDTSESMGLSHTVDAQISIWTEDEDFDLGLIHMGIVKNRFGPRKCTTVLEIDYPTLSLREPDEISNQFVVDRTHTPHPTKKDLTINNNDISSTLELIENLSE